MLQPFIKVEAEENPNAAGAPDKTPGAAADGGDADDDYLATKYNRSPGNKAEAKGNPGAGGAPGKPPDTANGVSTR